MKAQNPLLNFAKKCIMESALKVPDIISEQDFRAK